MEFLKVVDQAAEVVKTRLGADVRVAAILGSGLGAVVDAVQNVQFMDYADIPGFPRSSVTGHAGRLAKGAIQGNPVFFLQGRPHFYEGFSMKEVAFPVYLMKTLGVETLVITNACGGMNPNFEPGTLMIIEDFINLMGDNPLRGPHEDRLGPRFPDMTEPYSHVLIDKAITIADSLGISYAKGVYAGFPGPYYETAAEIRMIAGFGADAVGMSTVPETIAANFLGMDVFAVACITNMATGIQNVRHSHHRVLDMAKAAGEHLTRWLTPLLADWASES